MKNHYCLNPGEFFVAQQLAENRPELNLYYPLKDQGCDLLAVNQDGSIIVKIQVKESRTYPKKRRSWHQVKKEKIEAADVFVFVTYVPVKSGERLEFETQFIIIPGKDLREMCSLKTTSKEKYSFYFIKRDNGVWEERETGEPRDVTKYFGAWNLI